MSVIAYEIKQIEDLAKLPMYLRRKFLWVVDFPYYSITNVLDAVALSIESKDDGDRWNVYCLYKGLKWEAYEPCHLHDARGVFHEKNYLFYFDNFLKQYTDDVIFLDVGIYSASVSLLASLYPQVTKIYGYDPLERNIALSRSNLEQNLETGKFQLEQVLVGDKNCITDILDYTDTPQFVNLPENNPFAVVLRKTTWFDIKNPVLRSIKEKSLVGILEHITHIHPAKKVLIKLYAYGTESAIWDSLRVMPENVVAITGVYVHGKERLQKTSDFLGARFMVRETATNDYGLFFMDLQR